MDGFRQMLGSVVRAKGGTMDGFRRRLGLVVSILIKHLRSRLSTVHGLDFGIPAEKTGFCLLVYHDESRSLETGIKRYNFRRLAARTCSAKGV